MHLICSVAGHFFPASPSSHHVDVGEPREDPDGPPSGAPDLGGALCSKNIQQIKKQRSAGVVTTDACTAGMRTGILVEDSLTRSLLVPVWIHDAFINPYILTLGNVKSTSSLWSPADSSHNQNLKLSISALRSHWVQYHFFWVVYADLNDLGSSTKSMTTGFEHRGSSLWV